MLLRACIGAFVFLLVAADARQQGDDYAEARARLEQGLASLRAAAAGLPDTTVAAIGRRLRTPGACFEFVRQQVRFEPYAGVMRGSQGVLDAGGGNSAELCVLLRDLIAAGDSAMRMRFLLDGLADADAAALVDAAMLRPAARPAGLAVGDAPAAVAAPGEGAAQRLRDMAAAAGQALARAEAAAQQLAPLLGQGAADDRAAAIAASKQHVWLQCEHEGQWNSFDPVAGLEPPAGARAVDALPAEWQHTLALALEVERLQDGKLQREALFEGQWPVRELQGRAVEVLLLPEGLSLPQLLRGGKDTDLLAQAAHWKQFGVVVGVTGAAMQPGRAFDLEGRVKTAGAASPTGVGAVDPFRRLPRGGAVAAKSELSGVFLTARLRGPGGEQVVERALLDRVGAGARAANSPALAAAWTDVGRVRLSLLQRHVLWAPAGAAGGAAARELLDGLLHGSCLHAALDLQHGRWQGDRGAAFAGLPDLPTGLAGLADAALQVVEAAVAGDAFCFVAAPNLYLRDETLQLRGRDLAARVGIDVAVHRLAALGPGAGRARLLHGCLCSELEGDGVADASRWAAALLREGQAHGAALVPVRTAADLAKVEADADSKAVMAGELQRGATLLVLARPFAVAGEACTAWWRVARDGSVLAVGRDGRGQGGSEGMTVLKDISIPMVRRCMTFVACLNQAVAGGGSMQQAGADCLAAAIRDIVKDSLDKAIDSFVKDPWRREVGNLRQQVLGSDYDQLYKKAQQAWKRYREIRGAGDAATAAGADIGSAYGGRVYLLLVMGRDIAGYGSSR